MYEFFKNVKTLDELKAEYRRLANKHHPDRGGDTATMQRINAEHDKLFEILKAQQNARAAADTTGRTKATTETPEEFRDIVEKLITLDGLEIELCGAWLWIGGNTKQHKEELKSLGCRWSKNKQLWYWRHEEDARAWHRGTSTIGEIRTKYGSQIFGADGRETSNYSRLAAAV